MIWLRRVLEADILMATDALGPSNSPDDDGLETPDRILYSDLSTGGVLYSVQVIYRKLICCSQAWTCPVGLLTPRSFCICATSSC